MDDKTRVEVLEKKIRVLEETLEKTLDQLLKLSKKCESLAEASHYHRYQ